MFILFYILFTVIYKIEINYFKIKIKSIIFIDFYFYQVFKEKFKKSS